MGTAAYASMDITNAADVGSVVGAFAPDVIIHGAAMTHVDECELHPKKATLMNVEGTRNIAHAANEVGAHVVHISTDFIFDGKDGPYKEDALAQPLSHYGWTKLEAEEIIQELPSWSILRTVLVIGMAEDLSRSNIVLWAKGALEKGQAINVVDDQYRTPTQVAEHFGLSMASVTRTDSTTLNQPAKRPPRTGFDISKARKELGYRPHSFKEALEIIANQAGL
jgi:dTDP-4-dehydrorhamnose reductase